MKKLICALLAISSSLLFSNVALAKDTNASVIKPAGNAKQATLAPNYGTDIVITNYGAYDVYVRAPSLLSDGFWVYHGTAQHIHNYSTAPTQQILVSDYNGQTFYNYMTPNHYPIDVYDRDGHSFV